MVSPVLASCRAVKAFVMMVELWTKQPDSETSTPDSLLESCMPEAKLPGLLEAVAVLTPPVAPSGWIGLVTIPLMSVAAGV